jgi:hypothetical protein
MATINVKDAAGSTVALEKPLAAGQAAMAASRPVVLASDQSSIPVAATLAAETTKVIGTVRTASGGIASGSVAAGALAAGSGVDGWDLTQGAIADAAVTAGATGSISAKLRSISRDLIGGIVLQAGANIIGAVTQSGSWVIAAGTAIIGKVGIDQTTDGTTNKVAADVRLAGIAAATGSGVMGTGTQRVALATDSPGIITTGTAGTASAVVLSVQGIAGATPQPVGGVTVTQAASSTITRPADTTAYASGDLVANSVTAGSVTNLQFTTLARVSGGSGVIIGAQIQKSTASATNAAFRLHLFNTAPTYTSAGDNSAISTVVVASAKGYLGYIDITTMIAFSDVGWGSGAPDNSRGGIPYVATAQIIYGLLEARGAYTPGNAEVFTITVDALQD